MLRASSEIAVAISVASVAENPCSSASSRPLRRARTRSASDATLTLASGPGSSGRFVMPGFPVEVGKALLQVQRRSHICQRDPELHHRECYLRLDLDNDGFGTSQANHVRQVTQSP